MPTIDLERMPRTFADCQWCGRRLRDEETKCLICGNERSNIPPLELQNYEGYNHYEVVCPACGYRQHRHLFGDIKWLRNLDTLHCGAKGCNTILNPHLRQLPKHGHAGGCSWCGEDIMIFTDEDLESLQQKKTECPKCGAVSHRRLEPMW